MRFTARRPGLKRAGGTEAVGTVVIGTARGDTHDIGKNIVITMLKGNGFEVVDLGVDVPPEAFVDAARDTGASIVGISGLLMIVFEPMKQTVGAFERAGMRHRVKIAIGGAPMTAEVLKYIGADYLGKDAQDAVDLCRRAVAR